jgi:glycosyltransferase involved in cell wall biosynthesis
MSDIILPDDVEFVIVGLVGTLNPSDATVGTVVTLLEQGACQVVVVDDGSDTPKSAQVFERVAALEGVHVIHLEKNGGKSNALREGYHALPEDNRIIIAQVDDDTIVGDLHRASKLIRKGKADIVDVRVETFNGTTLIGNVQQLCYWLNNAGIKRVQNVLRARL